MPKDFLLDQTLDLSFANGDFLIGESTSQHQELLIYADKSEFKEVVMRGVGVKRFLEESKPDGLAREIRQEFISDGMQVDEIKITENLEIQVEAFYNE